MTAWLGCAALAYGWILAPAWRQCTQLEEQVRRRAVDLVRMQADWQRKESIEAEYAALAGTIQETGNLDQQIARFARSMDELYQDLPLQVQSVRILPAENLMFCQKTKRNVADRVGGQCPQHCRPPEPDCPNAVPLESGGNEVDLPERTGTGQGGVTRVQGDHRRCLKAVLWDLFRRCLLLGCNPGGSGSGGPSRS